MVAVILSHPQCLIGDRVSKLQSIRHLNVGALYLNVVRTEKIPLMAGKAPHYWISVRVHSQTLFYSVSVPSCESTTATLHRSATPSDPLSLSHIFRGFLSVLNYLQTLSIDIATSEKRVRGVVETFGNITCYSTKNDWSPQLSKRNAARPVPPSQTSNPSAYMDIFQAMALTTLNLNELNNSIL